MLNFKPKFTKLAIFFLFFSLNICSQASADSDFALSVVNSFEKGQVPGYQVTLGDSIENVVSKLGEPTKREKNSFIYESGNTLLSVHLTNNSVIGISLNSPEVQKLTEPDLKKYLGNPDYYSSSFLYFEPIWIRHKNYLSILQYQCKVHKGPEKETLTVWRY